jgi:hypothetical protein
MTEAEETVWYQAHMKLTFVSCKNQETTGVIKITEKVRIYNKAVGMIQRNILVIL